MKEQNCTQQCARCGKLLEASANDLADGERYCSFGCEVKSLLGGAGKGLRWLGMTLLWGAIVFALLTATARLMWRSPSGNSAADYGLIVVLGLMTVIISVLRRKTRL